MAELSKQRAAYQVYDVIWEAFGKKTSEEWKSIPQRS